MGMFKWGWFVLLLNIINVQANENFAEVTLAGSQIRTLKSQIVNQEYQLLITTPSGYGQTDKTYPVIYFLDAQWDFPLMVSTYGQSYYDGFVPEAILVGIQWGGENPNPEVLRARDFTPSNMAQVPNSGGAEKFLGFIKQELIPFIGSEYRTNGNRVLMGSSYGGLFTLYAMFNQPNLFNGYIPTASASGWDNNLLYSYAKTFSDKKLSRPITLYSAIGEFDGLMPAFDDLVGFFEKQNFKDVSFKFERLPGLGHASVKGAANTWGLHYVFAKPRIPLSEAELLTFIGQYRGNTSNTLIQVLSEQGQLQLQINGKKHPLFASSKQSFYQQGELLQATFDSAVKPQTLTVNRFMSVEHFSRIAK
ncbi:MAG: alpha/beta hydrolase-fold protein [Paraglaciecola sp.]|uniref:alpha/beta hydrolase n=1 Tax=Paraglaciecola sp. TaxID=1920173 RepID=UPI003299FEAA